MSFLQGLITFNDDPVIEPVTTTVAPAAELIHRRRVQMLVHSCLYYRLGTSLISDDIWQKWANELRDLQKEHGETWGFYDEAFKGWTGDSGFQLPQDGWILSRASYLMRMHEQGKFPYRH